MGLSITIYELFHVRLLNKVKPIMKTAFETPVKAQTSAAKKKASLGKAKLIEKKSFKIPDLSSPMKMPSKTKTTNKKTKTVSANGGVQKKKKTVVSSKPAKKAQLEEKQPRLSVVTSAGLKRVAQRAGIRQISTSCIRAVQEYLTSKAEDCFLHARSSAYHVSNTKTVHSRDLASALRTTRLGDLVCT